MKSAKFNLGQIVATPGALEALESAGQSPAEFLSRHVQGDWGEVDDEDKQANDDSLKTGDRLLSAYHLADDTTIWIITEAADENGRRSCSTLLMPSEY